VIARPVTAEKLIRPAGRENAWLGLSHVMEAWRGCEHACIYCITRGRAGAGLELIENAPELLAIELASGRRMKGFLGSGLAHDPWQPLEKELELSRRLLKAMVPFQPAFHAISKSPLILRDTDLFEQIGKRRVRISFSFSTVNDRLAALTEAHAPAPSQRLEALAELAKRKLPVGVVLNPVLPWLGDDPLSIARAIDAFRKAGAGWILAAPGLWLKHGHRTAFFKALEYHFPGLKRRYRSFYGSDSWLPVPSAPSIMKLLKEASEKSRLKLELPPLAEKRPARQKENPAQGVLEGMMKDERK
jgi:DNA repair photolyase